MTQLSVVSFGFRYGEAPRTDMALCLVVDLRSLPRPWKGVAAQTVRGTDKAFAAHLFSDGSVAEAWSGVLEQVKAFLAFVDECFAAAAPSADGSGKIMLQPPAIAIGCRSGRHRSVAFAERLAEHLRLQQQQFVVTVEHRDTARNPTARAPPAGNDARSNRDPDVAAALAPAAAVAVQPSAVGKFAIACPDCGVRTSHAVTWNQHLRSVAAVVDGGGDAAGILPLSWRRLVGVTHEVVPQ
jgi:UPF0042 nucleotide-binding protein